MLEGRGTTAKLWVVYFRIITIVKQFNQAERIGDCKLHLTCAVRMILFLWKWSSSIPQISPLIPKRYDKITICYGQGRISVTY